MVKPKRHSRKKLLRGARHEPTEKLIDLAMGRSFPLIIHRWKAASSDVTLQYRLYKVTRLWDSHGRCNYQFMCKLAEDDLSYHPRIYVKLNQRYFIGRHLHSNIETLRLDVQVPIGVNSKSHYCLVGRDYDDNDDSFRTCWFDFLTHCIKIMAKDLLSDYLIHDLVLIIMDHLDPYCLSGLL